VAAGPLRRRFSAEFKRRVLDEAAKCTEPGQMGALLRRHGLYSSHLTTWRAQAQAGVLAALAARKPGRRAAPKNPLAAKVAQLERELRRAQARAERAERLVEIQKKVSELLGIALPDPERGG
jgi:transposase-like protein